MHSSELELELELEVSAQYERMPSPARLDLAGLKKITALVSQGFLLNTGTGSRDKGILNVIGVTPAAFNKWLMNQDVTDREDLNVALLTQSVMLKQSMLETAIAAVHRLGDLSDRSIIDKDKIAATNLQGNAAIKILGILDVEHQRMEQEAPPQAKEIKANIISSDSERHRLQQLRDLSS